jgi:FkbH-like protein
MWAPETQILHLTQESQDKANLIQHTITRKKTLQDLSIKREDFLKSLNIQVQIKKLNEQTLKEIQRCFELTNKTNQFNTTGKRWKYDEFITFMRCASNSIFYIKIKDKNTDYGLVGLVYIENNKIIQFIMSCRVIGIDAEIKVMDYIETQIFKSYNQIQGIIIETSSNLPCRNLFKNRHFNLNNGVYIKNKQ